MATLTGTKIANTYKQLLQVGSSNTGLTGSVQTVQDGQGNNSPLQLSQSAVNIDGTFQLSGVTLTANASTLNAVADLTGATGIVAVSAGNVYGRTITGGTGVSITNGDGTEGNPTIALNTTGVVSASYGPATNIEVNSVGQIVSAGAAASVAVSAVTANTFTGGTFEGTTGNFSGTVSVGGNLIVGGEFTPAALSVTGTINAATISATDGTFNNIVSAAYFVGDGSGLVNVPSSEGGTVKTLTAGPGITLLVDASPSDITVSGTVQLNDVVSVSSVYAAGSMFITGTSVATIDDVAAVSVLTQTNLDSITSINSVISNVSALTSVNAAAITSINVVVANVSALTSVNAAAITSINAIIEGDVSADSGTFNTLTVITSASIGGTLNVGGNVSIGGDLTAGAATFTDLTTSSANTVQLSGNGTSGQRLMVGDTGLATCGIGIESNSTATTGVYFWDGANDGAITYNHTSREMLLRSGGTTALTLDSSQNATIAGALTVTDNTGVFIELTDTATAPDASWRIYPQTGNTTRLLRFTDYNTGTPQDRMVIDGSGNVGIGTSSPSSYNNYANNLVVYENGNAGITIASNTTSSASIHFADGTAGTESYRGIVLYNHAGDNMRFYTSAIERVRIDSSGNVGIGTDTPSAKLDVNGTLSAGATTVSTGSSGVTPDVAVDDLFVEKDNTAGITIGTPNTASGVLAFADPENNLAGRVQYNHLAQTLALYTEGVAFLTGDSSQNATFAGDVTVNGGNVTLTDATSARLTLNDTGGASWAISSAADDLTFGISGVSNYLTLNNTSATFAGYIGAGDGSYIGDGASSNSAIALNVKPSANSENGIDVYAGTNASQFALRVNNHAGTQLFKVDGAGAANFAGDVGIGTSAPAKQLHITKAAKADIGTLTDGATITPDFDANQNFSVTLGGNRTLANPSNIDAGQTGSIFVVQDGTGSRTLSFGSYWKFAGGTAPTLSTAAGSVDRIDYIVYTTTAIHAVATLNVS